MPLSLAVAVGQEEEPVSPVRGADGGSGYTIPPRNVPERGKVGDDGVEPPRSQGGDVLDDDVGRSALDDDPPELSPQARALSSEARTLASKADILAWESTTEHVALWEVGCSHMKYIRELRNVRPMAREGGTAEFLLLDLKHGMAHASPLHPKLKATDPREK